MPKTSRNTTRKTNKGSTRKNYNSLGRKGFNEEITIVFFEMLLMVKLFHWKTHSYASHKASDELYSKLNDDIDKFIEVLLGKTGTRIDLMSNKTIKLVDLSSQEALKSEVEKFKSYLVGLNENAAMKKMLNSDLYNIRDEILGDMNQFLYLLSFK